MAGQSSLVQHWFVEMHAPSHGFVPTGHPAGGGGTTGTAAACWALCFLAFLRHAFFCLPDFFLQCLSGSWASALAPPSNGASAAARVATSARRCHPVVRERVSASKRSASIAWTSGVA